jgi:hypothetical protein
MRTKIHWARKSQQPLAMLWIIARLNSNLNDSASLAISDSESKYVCTTDKKIDNLTDRIVTYYKCSSC